MFHIEPWLLISSHPQSTNLSTEIGDKSVENCREAAMNKDFLYSQILRILFKYNLVPRSSEQETAFRKELAELLKL